MWWLLLALSLALLMAASFARPAEAAPGDLDATFSGDGKVTTSIGSGHDYARALAIQSNGKIVVAGNASYGFNSDFVLARYNPNGSLDTSFGNGGKVTGSGLEAAYDLAIQSDGKIVVAGTTYSSTTYYDFALARYNPDGTPDASFGTNGMVSTHFVSGNDSAQGLAIQSDGKIVAGGSADDGTKDFALARYNPNGTLDTSFGSGGKVITPIGSSFDYARALALQSDGKIVLAGTTNNGSNDDFALARYSPNGALDTSFDSDGKVTTPIGPKNDFANALAIQKDGKIVVVGSSNSGGVYDNLALVRYSPNGSLDASFASGGKLVTGFGTGHSIGNDVSVQEDGKIVLAGYFGTDFNYDFALARVNSGGSLDSTFSGDGRVITPIGSGHDYANALVLQSDGKIVVAGSSFNGVDSGYDFAVARYEGDDRTPPNTAITSGPSGITRSTSSTFRFVSSEPGSKFQCRLDGAAFSVCASPKSYTNLSQGKHIFRVRAIDPAGNADPTPAGRSWIVDTVAPKGTVKINGGATYTRSPSVKLSLSASDPSPASGLASMRFKNVGGSWSGWMSYATTKSWTLKKANGTRTVYVQYRDRAGNISTAAADRIKLDMTKPTVSGMLPKPGSTTTDTTPTIKATVKDNLTNLSKGNIKLYVDGKQVPKTKFSYNRSTDRLVYTSRKLSLGKHAVKIVARDTAGNVAVRRWSFKVVRR